MSLTNTRTRQKKVDYLKLNDSLEESSELVKSPKVKKRHTHLPSQSGPSSTRQKAQKIVTSPPAQVLALLPIRHRSGKPADDNNEISGVHSSENTTTTQATLIENPSNVSGVQSSVSGVRDALLTTVSMSKDVDDSPGGRKISNT